MKISYYISPDGSDRNPGTLEKPFRTLEKARDVLRDITPGERSRMEEDVTIYLRGGSYPVSEPIVFTDADSGMNGNYTVYRNYPGEEPVLTGGMILAGWRPSNRGGIKGLWECTVPEHINTRQLFVDGLRQVRARSEGITVEGWKLHEDPDMRFAKLVEQVETFQGIMPVYAGYQTSNAGMADWGNKKDIEFVYDVGWSHSICPVEDIQRMDDGGAYVAMRMPCFRDCQIKGGVQIGSPNYIENAFELLDTSGEWYFDRNKGVLYHIPLPDIILDKSQTVIPTVEQLLLIRGRLESPVHHLRFEGITFEYTTWLRPGEEGHPEIQANLVKDPQEDRILHSCFLKPPSAVVLDAAQFVGVTGCTFRRMGSGALDIQHGSRNIEIRENHIYDISGSGIQIGDFNHTDAHPKDEREIVREIVIANNHLHDIGMEFKGSIGINAGFVQEIHILNNEIHDVAYSGISMGWGWGLWDPDYKTRNPGRDQSMAHYPRFDKETVAKSNHIEYNHIYRTMMRLTDGGGIYTLSLQPGSTIRGNCIHDNGHYPRRECLQEVSVNGRSPCPDSKANPERYKELTAVQGFPGGIYLDEGSGGFTISDNIVYAVPVALHFNDIGIPGRFETNRIMENHFNDPNYEFAFITGKR